MRLGLANALIAVPSYPSGDQVHQYLTSFAEHFNLYKHIELGVSIKQITLDDEKQKWVINVEGQGKRYFDKVVIANGGMVARPLIPQIEGLDTFKGISVHTQSFKRPKDYAGKRVMVVGFGNSAGDTSTQLVAVADKVYISHRHGARILPRGIDGAPIDHVQSFRLFSIQGAIMGKLPYIGRLIMDRFVQGLQDKCFDLTREQKAEWGLEPAQTVPLVSDHLIDHLKDGSIKSVKGIKRISGKQVELLDGMKVEVDVIVWCTGYQSDFSMIEPRFDPTRGTQSAAWKAAGGSNGKSQFRLYHNLFSLDKPDSLAFLGNVIIPVSGFQIFDTASMAIAQVWKGASPLPSQAQMEKAVARHHAYLVTMASRTSNVSPGTLEPGTWTKAMDKLAGTGVDEYLGYGWKGWMFWLRERKLCNLLMGGIWSPHIYRVFDGKRKKWDGAVEAIERVNAAIAESKKRNQKAKAS
jgi:dimethylaniline monooxygenase (N-oxide forming)